MSWRVQAARSAATAGLACRTHGARQPLVMRSASVVRTSLQGSPS